MISPERQDTTSGGALIVSPADQQIIRQTFGFLRGIIANPELAKDIPDGANVVLIPPDDPELAAVKIEAGMLALSRGLDVYFRHIRPGDILPPSK